LLAYQIADHIARVAKRAVLVVCEKDSAPRVARHMICLQAGVWPMAFVTDPKQRTLESLRAFEKLAPVPILLDDRSTFTISEMIERLVQFATERNVIPGAIIVDDALHVVATEEFEYESEAIVTRLRDVASTFDIDVIVTAKVNRFVEKRRDRRPRISDFNRPYSSYVQAADIVLALYRDDIYNARSPDVGIVEVASLSNRFGERGVARLRAGRYRFEDL
jgi:replicative DNA helicase